MQTQITGKMSNYSYIRKYMFKTKNISRDKDGDFYDYTKVNTTEDTTITNVKVPNNWASKYMKQKFRKLKEKLEKHL